MKKILLLIPGICIASGIMAQSLWLQKTTGVKIGDAGEFELVSYNSVVNTGSAPMTVKVTRNVIATSSSFDNAICWQLCYLPSVDTTPDPLVLIPGDTVENFSGHLYPNGNTGSAEIEYIFYDVDNPSNTWSYTVNYHVFGIGLEEHELSIGKVYPNPARELVCFDIENRKPATLEIFDMPGKKVARMGLSAREGKVTMNVSHLKPGLYFCTLRNANGELAQTRRLVIRR